jgi:oligoribonuclease
MAGPSAVVVDFETTGLNPATGVPLELGMLIVDNDLNILRSKSLIVQPAAQPLWDEMDPVVVEMHTKNGLIPELKKDEGMVAAVVEDEFIDWLEHHNATGLPMLGSSVQFDRSWMRVHMGGLEELFHYRNIDVSTVKELCRRWNPRVFDHAPVKVEMHRSLPDCHDTVAELVYYRDNFLWVDFGDNNGE